MNKMWSFTKKKVLGTPSKVSIEPVIATPVYSPNTLLARECSGRHAKKSLDSTIIYNQFEQLKRFQSLQSMDTIQKPKSSHNASMFVIVLLISILSAVIASVVTLGIMSNQFNYNSTIIPYSGIQSNNAAMMLHPSVHPKNPVSPIHYETLPFQVKVKIISNSVSDNKIVRPQNKRRITLKKLKDVASGAMKGLFWEIITSPKEFFTNEENENFYFN